MDVCEEVDCELSSLFDEVDVDDEVDWLLAEVLDDDVDDEEDVDEEEDDSDDSEEDDDEELWSSFSSRRSRK